MEVFLSRARWAVLAFELGTAGWRGQLIKGPSPQSPQKAEWPAGSRRGKGASCPREGGGSRTWARRRRTPAVLQLTGCPDQAAVRLVALRDVAPALGCPQESGSSNSQCPVCSGHLGPPGTWLPGRHEGRCLGFDFGCVLSGSTQARRHF